MRKSDFKKDWELVKDEYVKKSILHELEEIKGIIERNGRFKEYPLNHNQLVSFLYELTAAKNKYL